MTSYSHTVTFSDIERISIENMVKQAIEEFKTEHPDGSPPVPWWLESILEKFKHADMNLFSTNNFSEGGNDIFINPLKED